MKRKLLTITSVAVTVFMVYFVVLAFTEPSLSPPQGNVPPPINVGAQTQSKAGDLELKNLKSRGGITLGGVFRNSWPGGSGGCAWEGTKCDCASDGSSAGNTRIVIGTTCTAGQVTGFKIVNFEISSRSKSCGVNPPAGCTAGLYTR